MVILEEKNIKKEFFDYIYTDIFVDWASYGFNKSHSTCYSIIAYITGWLKCKYPYHYYSVILRGCESDPTKTSKIINEMNILGIDIV
jgi:DNA polymerase III, alpha subunit